MILADKIIQLRKRCGMSQDELAELINVSRQSVSKWEGALSVPDLDKILKMSEIFGVSTDYLLKDEEGKVYIKGTSLWCLYSKEKQRLMPTKCAEIEGAEYCLEKNFDEPFLRIAITESDAFETCFQHTINVEDVDRNGHMNNCRYSHLVDLALLKDEKEIQRFEINYVMQCYEHEELVIKKYRKEKEIFVLGEKKEGIVFITRILLR